MTDHTRFDEHGDCIGCAEEYEESATQPSTTLGGTMIEAQCLKCGETFNPHGGDENVSITLTIAEQDAIRTIAEQVPQNEHYQAMTRKINDEASVGDHIGEHDGVHYYRHWARMEGDHEGDTCDGVGVMVGAYGGSIAPVYRPDYLRVHKLPAIEKVIEHYDDLVRRNEAVEAVAKNETGEVYSEVIETAAEMVDELRGTSETPRWPDEYGRALLDAAEAYITTLAAEVGLDTDHAAVEAHNAAVTADAVRRANVGPLAAMDTEQAQHEREVEHAQRCEGEEPHSWNACPTFGWDEQGIYEKVRVAREELADREETERIKRHEQACAGRVRMLLWQYRNEHDHGEEMETVLADLLTDLRHLAATDDLGWETALDRSLLRYEEEVIGE